MPFLTNFPKCWEIFQIILWNILSNSKQYKKFRRSLRLIFPQYWIPWLTCVSVRVNSSWFPVILGIFHPLLWIRNLQFSTLFMYSYKHNIQHFAIIPVLLVLINNRLSHPLVFPHVSFFFRKQSLTAIRKLFRATLVRIFKKLDKQSSKTTHDGGGTGKEWGEENTPPRKIKKRQHSQQYMPEYEQTNQWFRKLSIGMTYAFCTILVMLVRIFSFVTKTKFRPNMKTSTLGALLNHKECISSRGMQAHRVNPVFEKPSRQLTTC